MKVAETTQRASCAVLLAKYENDEITADEMCRICSTHGQECIQNSSRKTLTKETTKMA
jgi:hypothetical protein